MNGAVTVAKKRGRKVTGESRTALVTFKCRPEYKAWLVKFAEHQRDIPSRLIDLALVGLAESLGFDAPPKR